MGNVYRAEHKLMGRVVALKLIQNRLLGKPDWIERLSSRSRSELHSSCKAARATTPYDGHRQRVDAAKLKDLVTMPISRHLIAKLYSAILREINVKGPEARFQKTEPGRFAVKA